MSYSSISLSNNWKRNSPSTVLSSMPSLTCSQPWSKTIKRKGLQKLAICKFSILCHLPRRWIISLPNTPMQSPRPSCRHVILLTLYLHISTLTSKYFSNFLGKRISKEFKLGMQLIYVIWEKYLYNIKIYHFISGISLSICIFINKFLLFLNFQKIL